MTDEPIRIISIAVINVLRADNILVEKSQKMRNGSIHKRLRNIMPREKIKIGESIQYATMLCLEEELNITNNDFKILIVKKEPKIFFKESDSYPGLLTKYNQFDVSVQEKTLPLTTSSQMKTGKNTTL